MGERLRHLAQWINWRLEDRPGEPKPAKVPFDPLSGQRIDPMNPVNWRTQEQVAALDPAHIGFVLTASDPYFFIDLDHAWDGHQWSALTGDVLARFPGAYVETSFSGDGLHVIGQGVAPEGYGTRGDAVEFYTRDRFVAITGFHAYGDPDAYDHTSALSAFVPTYLKPQTPITHLSGGTSLLSDEQALDRLLNGAVGAETAFNGRLMPQELWQGLVPEDGRSEADMALAMRLAFWCSRDMAQIERIMRRSALVRPKWDTKRGNLTYLQYTIQRACATVSNTYQPTPGVPIATIGDLRLVPTSEIEKKPITWLYKNWLPSKAITILVGPPEAGKSSIAWTIAAMLSRGQSWLGGPPLGPMAAFNNGCGVVIHAGEDDPEYTVVPTLEEAGANMDRIFIPKVQEGPFQPAEHLALLAEKITDDIGLLILDPVLAVASSAKDEYRANDIRKALAPVEKLAAEKNIAVLGITHFTKGSKGMATIERAIGSQAWGAVARMMWAADRPDPDAPRILARAKNNLGPSGDGFAYDISGREERGITYRRLTFGGNMQGHADQLLGSNEDDETPKKNSAKEWIRQYLANEPEGQTWALMEQHAKGEGHTLKTLRSARSELQGEKIIEQIMRGARSTRVTLWKLCS